MRIGSRCARGLAIATLVAASACTGDSGGRDPGIGSPTTDTNADDTSMATDGVDDAGPADTETGALPTSAGSGSGSGGEEGQTDSDTGTGPTNTGDGTTGEAAVGDWLLTIDDAAASPALVRIDVNTGAGQPLCVLPGASSFNSLVLGPDGTLFVHNATQTRIERVDPCDCGFTIVGSTSAGALEIGPDVDDGMFGVDTELDALYAIDSHTGLANPIGPLGQDFAGSAITYSDALPGLIAIDDGTNQLYGLDPETGAASLMATLSALVTAPGFAYRAADDTFYVCESDVLYTLNVGSGVLTPVGPIGLVGDCTSLAAPRSPEACLD